MLRGFNAGAREVARRELDELTEHAKRFGAKGLIWAVVGEDGGWDAHVGRAARGRAPRARSPRRCGAAPGDLLLIVADATEALGELRLEIARRYGLTEGQPNAIVWVTDFPMFETAADGSLTAMHHPFTAPQGRADLLPRGYDLALNGVGDRRRLDPHPRRRGPAAGLRGARHRRRRRRRRASASCSTGCATARRRTAASPWASTASSRSSPASRRSAT